MYPRGQGVPQDYNKAMEFLLKAAEQDYADAQHYIGIHTHLLNSFLNHFALMQELCTEMGLVLQLTKQKL